MTHTDVLDAVLIMHIHTLTLFVVIHATQAISIRPIAKFPYFTCYKIPYVYIGETVVPGIRFRFFPLSLIVSIF